MRKSERGAEGGALPLRSSAPLISLIPPPLLAPATQARVGVEIFWNNTFHVKSLMMKIFTNFKSTQAKSLKIVVTKSLITNAHKMIIISHICRLPYRGYVTLKLYFTYKATQIGKRYYFSWLKNVNCTVIVNFTLKIEMVPQQELRVSGGEKRMPELATFWRSKRRKIPVSSYVTMGSESTLISSGIPICCYFSSNKSTCLEYFDVLRGHNIFVAS